MAGAVAGGAEVAAAAAQAAAAQQATTAQAVDGGGVSGGEEEEEEEEVGLGGGGQRTGGGREKNKGGAVAAEGEGGAFAKTDPNDLDGDDDDDDDEGADASVLPVSVLRAYVAWAKSNASVAANVHPEAEEVASAYYREARQRRGRAPSRTTVRLLPSLVRLAQAHARLTGRGQVTRQDAVVAAMVAESSMAGGEGPLAGVVPGSGGGGGGGGGGGDGPGGAAHFPADPDEEYARLEPRVLRALGLDHLVGTPLPEWVPPGSCG
jgi:hypothetical protein